MRDLCKNVHMAISCFRQSRKCSPINDTSYLVSTCFKHIYLTTIGKQFTTIRPSCGKYFVNCFGWMAFHREFSLWLFNSNDTKTNAWRTHPHGYTLSHLSRCYVWHTQMCCILWNDMHIMLSIESKPSFPVISHTLASIASINLNIEHHYR